MRTKTRVVCAALALTITAALTACSGGSSGKGDSATGEPVHGGDLIYLDAEVPYSFHFGNLSYWQNQAVANNVLDRLLFQDPTTAELKPWIAESWNVSQDGLVYTFVIRDGVTYQDGSTLDAENVKRNLEFQARGDDKGNTRNTYFPAVASVKADNSTRTVTVTLEKPNSYFLNTLSYHQAGLVSSAYFDLTFDQQGDGRNLLGSGPFTITEAGTKQTVITKRQGYNWAPPSLEHQGEAYLDSITYIPVDEDSIRLGTLSSGQADLLRYVEPSEETGAKKKGLQVIAQRFVDGLSTNLAFGTNTGVLTDPAVRQAISLAIDRDNLVKTIYSDSYLPSTGFLRTKSPDYVDFSKTVTYDPTRAGQLLEQSGWVLRNGSDIRVDATGQPLVIKALVDVYHNTSPVLFQYLQLELKKIGIDFQLTQVDYASYPSKSKTPELSGIRLISGGRDAGYNLARYASSQYSDYFQLKGSDPELDQLADSIIAGNLDSAQQHAAIVRLQNHLIEKSYVTPIADLPQVFIAQPYVHGFDQIRSSPWLYSTWLSK